MHTQADFVEIASGDERLAGTFAAPAGPVPGVLFVHGWGGSQQQYLARSRATAALGCVCLSFDLTGHGATAEQQKEVSRDQNLRDVVAAYDVLTAHPNVDRERVAVIGSSYGGYLAAILSSKRAVRWLALRSPALYIDSDWRTPKARLSGKQHLESWRRSFVPANGNRALMDCAAFDGDVLLVESERDEVIPRMVIASYFEAFWNARTLTHRVLSGADHGLADEASQRAWSALLMRWLNEMALSTDEAAPSAAIETVSTEMLEAPRGEG